MTQILIRKGLNGFRYSACGEKGNHLFNANTISMITGHWKKQHQEGMVTFVRQLDRFPDDWQQAGTAMDTIGERLRQLRKLRGLTKRGFAALLNISEKVYGAMEDGHRPVSRYMGKAIAAKLRISSRWLLEGSGSMEDADMTRKGRGKQ